ncbi:MAG: site-specific DNA-methyltransferase [Candidatus Paceibacterota bacterium]
MRVIKSEEIAKNGEDFNKSYVSTEFINKTMDVLLKDAVNKKGTDEIVDLFGEKIFSYPKNEILLHQIIEYCTQENDIIMDFFSGSGTTAAVAHKMNRQYIAVEQMDYVENIIAERLKKVIDGDRGGISEEVGWFGGGSFVYAELFELNKQYIQRIQDVKLDEEIEGFVDEIKNAAFLDYKINIDRLTKEDSEFSSLLMEDKKKVLIDSLDKNQMYLSYSEIDDDQYDVPETVKCFNHSFYQKSKVVNKNEQ